MSEEKISVISIECLSFEEIQREDEKEKCKTQKGNEISPWNICHVLSVLTICVTFLATITLVPRTNSILYPSYWYELSFCYIPAMILKTANDAFHVAAFLKGKSIYSLWTTLKTFSLYLVTLIVPYLIAYLVWCQYLNYNWPIPYLGYNYMLFIVVYPAALWISLPRGLRRKKSFQDDFKIFILYSTMFLIFSILREVMSILFKVFPRYLQWIIAFLVPLLKKIEYFGQSILVNRMAGGQEEESQVLLGLTIDGVYAIFIAVRLPNAETITVCFIIAVDFVLLLWMTYKIVQSHNMISNEASGNGNTAKQQMVTNLVLAELTEGIVPIVYAIGISFGYYGYNGDILGDVKNDYWGYQPIDDIGYHFQVMALLFGFDGLSTLINYIILSTLTNVAFLREFCRIMKKYWHFIAVKFAYKMLIMFLIKDINFGIDATGKLDWITNDGRIKLINGSTDLSYQEKSLLFDEFV